MNCIIIMGRLTRDPEIRYTERTAVTRFSVAVNRPMGAKKDGKPKADFINCVAFGKTAEVISNYVQKGHRLLVRGSLQCDTYTDKNNVSKTSYNVVVDSIDFCEAKGSAPNGGQGSNFADAFSDGSDVPFAGVSF